MSGLYIHIPYCHSKCAYCDFYSMPRTDTMRQYVDALLTELDLRISEVVDRVTTVYIGGGTPSILPIELLSKIVKGVSNYVDLSSIEEFTIEANPEDVTSEWVGAIRHLGINRVSMGIQSFNDEELEIINRRHTARTALQAVEILRHGGITCISGDLIYGLPGQDLESWKYSLEMLMSLQLPHFSAYLLSYEPGTGLYVRLMAGKVEEASEELANEMYQHLIDSAQRNGYCHYEISNFAQPGQEAIHNTNYWRDFPYLGIGVSAHSFDGKKRRFNPANIKEYIAKLSQKKCYCEIEEEDADARHNDYIIVALRTAQGIDILRYKEQYGVEAYCNMMNMAAKHIEEDRMVLTDSHLSINEQYMLISDRIMLDFII